MATEAPKFKVRKKKLGSYPYLSVVFSITLALFVMGIFGALVIYSQELERVIRENVKIQVFLKNQVSDSQRAQIQKNLSSRYFVSKKNQESAITFISKQEAANQFIKETGEDFKKFLGDNPLRDAFLIRVDEAYHDNNSLKKIKSEVEKIGGVYQVHYVENLIDSINQNVTKIGLILMSMVALLLITVVLLINNTLKLALFSQRFLIRSMQLVGAKKWFIQRPFILRASAHGLLAGAIASGLLFGVWRLATERVEELKVIQNSERLLLLIASLLLLGVLIASISTFRAVSKYLKLSLDELY